MSGTLDSMKSLAEIIVPGVLALVSVVALVLWTAPGWVAPLDIREPGLDNAPSADELPPRIRPVVGEPTIGTGVPSELPGEWPWFRGPKLNAICDDGIALARSWPEDGPKRLWEVELGSGFAGAAVRDGRVYVLDYDETALADTMRCLSLDDARQEIWRGSYPVEVPFNHGMSRTVPAVVGEHVISFGPMCHVACWDAKTGRSNWLMDLVLDYNATVPGWFAGQCPLVDGDRLILATGGDALLIAVDYSSGDEIWRSENPRGWAMTHSSITPMGFGGRRMYVYCGSGGVAGVAADEGEVLWHTTAWKIKQATCPSPVVLPGGKIFLCGGYMAGSVMLQLKQQGDAVVVEEVFRLNDREFGSEQHTPVFFDGHLFGVCHSSKQLVCLDTDGNEAWNSGKYKFGLGQNIISDGLVFVLDNCGWLS